MQADTAPQPPPAAQGGVSFTTSGQGYLIGYGPDFYGVWNKRDRAEPVARFPKTDEGWKGAWLHYSTLEGAAVPRATKSTTNRKTSPATAALALFLLTTAVLFVLAFANPRLNIPVVSKVTCSVKGGIWTEGSAVWGYPAGCYGAQSP
jgi:hypothetical protein